MDVNPSFCRVFRVTPEETIGRLISELGDGQWDIPSLRTLLENVWGEDGEFNDYEVDHEFPGIGRRTMLMNARQLSNDGEKKNLVLLSIEDITSRRQAEAETAHRQRTWFQTALRSIGDAVIATDADARVTFMNPAAEAITGWTQQQAAGKPLHTIFNIINEESRVTVENPVSKAIRHGASVGSENHTILISRDGIEHQIDDNAAPIRDEWNGNIVGVVMVFRDITERRTAEQRLKVSEVRYRRLFEAAHDGILILNAKTRKITEVNPFMLQLLDYSRDHFVEKELWEIGIFRDKAANQKAMQALHENGSIRFEDLPLQDRNGHRHPVEIVANIYQEGSESVIQCNIRDIGERVLFEREREALLRNEQAARMESEAANRAKDLFLATLSHEVRTPLNAILGWASILRTGKCDAADLQEGMEVIERNCRAQAQLIDDVLDVSRIISGKLHLQIRPCELVTVINAAIDVARPTAIAKGVTIEASFDNEASHCSCDMARMQQVIWNLLTNAVKFTPPGRKVWITLARDHSAIRIEVRDEGQGISPEFLPYVFDRFRQADSTAKRKFGGLGLGLSIVKQIVQLHGGSVQADSAGEGRGANFTIKLPVRAVEIDEDPSAVIDSPDKGISADILPVRLDELRVMVVDDEADARRLLVKVLGEVGATVSPFASVDEAMVALGNVKPQILLSDIAMPEKDGFDLIRQVREAGHSSKELPAVALTAFAHKEDRRRAMLAGFQMHLSKPIDPHDLIAVIATLAGRTD